MRLGAAFHPIGSIYSKPLGFKKITIKLQLSAKAALKSDSVLLMKGILYSCNFPCAGNLREAHLNARRYGGSRRY